MKIIGKSIAVAVFAASATGAAQAAIQFPDHESLQGSELVFNLVNYTAQNSFVLDLGITIADFIANPAQTFSFTLNDNNFTSFAQTYNVADNATWGVSGAYSLLNDFPDLDKYGFYTTSVSQNPASFDTNAADIGNTIANKWVEVFVKPIQTLDANSVNNSAFNVVGEAGYTGDVGNDFQTALPFVAQGAVGSSLFFVREKVNSDDFDTGELQTFANIWNFSINGGVGTLTFGPAVAAVPLPAAVWMFGAGLMGMLRLNRRRPLLAA